MKEQVRHVARKERSAFRGILAQIVVALAILLGAVAARADFVGDLAKDMVWLEQAYDPALEAIGAGDFERSWSAIELLYARWLTFRRFHIDAHLEDPRFATDMERIGQHLDAAARLIDECRPLDAHRELQAGRVILLDIRARMKTN